MAIAPTPQQRCPCPQTSRAPLQGKTQDKSGQRSSSAVGCISMAVPTFALATRERTTPGDRQRNRRYQHRMTDRPMPPSTRAKRSAVRNSTACGTAVATKPMENSVDGMLLGCWRFCLAPAYLAWMRSIWAPTLVLDDGRVDTIRGLCSCLGQPICWFLQHQALFRGVHHGPQPLASSGHHLPKRHTKGQPRLKALQQYSFCSGDHPLLLYSSRQSKGLGHGGLSPNPQ
mmetsp:Transcript_89871/g.249631  ORF Transcript_89871/g.249631 Transcript_89871/m.249631 type:complete len:229 (-) Transcript_89871:1408-2094(-)